MSAYFSLQEYSLANTISENNQTERYILITSTQTYRSMTTQQYFDLILKTVHSFVQCFCF